MSIVGRIGIDAEPVDLGDDDARAWLRACTPSESGAQRRAAAAATVVREGSARIVAGDGVGVLADVVAAVSDGLLVAIVDTSTAVFLDEGRQRRLRDVVADIGRDRDVAWISLDPLVPLGTDARHSVQGIDVRQTVIDESRRGVVALLAMVAHLAGSTTTDVLATAHRSGTRMRWLRDR